MEFLGLLDLLFQGSCCLLEIFAASSNIGAGIAGVKARRQINSNRSATERGEPPPSSAATAITIFVILLVVGIILTSAVIAKWSRF